MQPTGVYKNLFIRPATVNPSAQTPAATPTQPPIQPPVQQNPQIQTPGGSSSVDIQNETPKKKKSHIVLFSVLALSALAAGLFAGAPALGRTLDTINAKKVVEAAPFNFLKPPLRAARKALVSFGSTMDGKFKDFRKWAQGAVDNLQKWHPKNTDAES